MFDWLGNMAEYILPFLVVLTILVFVHELGHYWIARRNGVKVEVFSIGFGPELFGWTAKSGTRWKVSALPLGGYVKMYGDMDATSRPDDEKFAAMTPEQRAVAFPMKPLGARAWIVAGGPLANFLFAFLLLIGLFLFEGQTRTPALITGIVEDSAAEAAGLQVGDRIVSVNGEAIERFEDLQRFVQLNLERPIEMIVEREGQSLALTAQPRIVEIPDPSGCPMRIARLGIAAEGREVVEFGPLEAVGVAATETWGIARDTLAGLWQIITGERSTDELGGPVRIAELSGTMAKFGLVSIIWFMAVISVNLGLINLFPIPVLDGGHLLFYAIEGVRGRPLGERAQEYGFKIGIALVLSLMIFATINDLVRIGDCAG